MKNKKIKASLINVLALVFLVLVLSLLGQSVVLVLFLLFPLLVVSNKKKLYRDRNVQLIVFSDLMMLIFAIIGRWDVSQLILFFFLQILLTIVLLVIKIFTTKEYIPEKNIQLAVEIDSKHGIMASVVYSVYCIVLNLFCIVPLYLFIEATIGFSIKEFFVDKLILFQITLYFVVDIFVTIGECRTIKRRRVKSLIGANLINVAALSVLMVTFSAFHHGFKQNPGVNIGFGDPKDAVDTSWMDYKFEEGETEQEEYDRKKRADMEDDKKVILTILLYFVVKSYASILFYLATNTGTQGGIFRKVR